MVKPIQDNILISSLTLEDRGRLIDCVCNLIYALKGLKGPETRQNIGRSWSRLNTSLLRLAFIFEKVPDLKEEALTLRSLEVSTRDPERSISLDLLYYIISYLFISVNDHLEVERVRSPSLRDNLAVRWGFD